MAARNQYENARMVGIQAAMSLSRRLGVRKRLLNGNEGHIDVFSIIEELDIPFTFAELDKALGFCLPHPRSAIVVTTRASLHRQRFTAAHELGHAILEHEGSIDTDMLMRGGQSMTNGDLKEIEAEAFAAELLLPKWLLVHHIRKKGWTLVGHLPNPEIVYQLSLRVAASYEATCWGLFGNQLLANRDTLRALLKAGERLAKVKQATIDPLDYHLGHANALRLFEDDGGTRFPLSRDDVIRLDLPENAAGGYVWDLSTAGAAGFDLKYDAYIALDETRIGAASKRRLVFTPPEGSEQELLLSERRPWEKAIAPMTVFGATFDVVGPEKAGISRARRRSLGLDVA